MLNIALISLAVTALALMLAFPQTPTGAWLRRQLIEPPARFLANFTWAKLGKTLLFAGAVALLSLMGPEMMLVLAASGLDAAALLEVLIIVWLAAVSGGAIAAWRAARRTFTAVTRFVSAAFELHNRSRAPRRSKPRRPPKTGDQDEPGWAFA